MKNPTSRREFLTRSAMAAAAAAIPLSESKSSNIFNFSPPSNERRIHVFTKALTWMSYDDMAALVAEAGSEGIDLPVRTGGHVLPENVERDLPKAFEAAMKRGLKIEMIVTEITSTGEKYTETILKTASSLGIRYYRLGYLNYDENLGIWGTLQKYRAEFKKLEDLNKKYNIHGAYQNHSGIRIGGAVWDIYELVRDLDPEYFGCQYDIRHAVVEGSFSWVTGFNLIRPWIKCTDIKDFKWAEADGKWNTENVPLGEGMVNFDEYFSLVRKYNIPGPMSLHFEYPPFERYNAKVSDTEKKKLFVNAMKKDIEKLKSFRTRYQL